MPMSEEPTVLLVEPNIVYRGNTGGAVHLTELVRELKDRVDLHVVCDVDERFAEDGVEFYPSGGCLVNLCDLPTVWNLAKDADVVHSRADPFEVAGPIAAWRHGLPLVGEINVNFLAYEKKHSFRDLLYPFFHLAKYLWLKLWVKRYDRVITVSESIADELRGLGFRDTQLRVVHNGGNPDRFADADPDRVRDELELQDELVVLLMGELGPRHGLDRLLDLNLERVTFLVLGGTDKYRSYLEDRKDEAGDDFVFHDPVPYDDVADFVAASDVVVAPYDESDNDHPFGFCPIKILDGMAAGKPVVASDRQWIHEILSDDEGAVTDDLAGGIAAMRDDAIRAAKGENALERLKDGLTWGHTAEKVVNVYRELVDSDEG